MARRTSTTPNLDAHGDDWRGWVMVNIERDCAPLDLFRDMIKGDWAYDQAGAALDEALRSLGRPTDWRRKAPRLPAADRVEIDGLTVSVTSRMSRPQGAMLDGILTGEECDGLIALASERGFKRSNVVDHATGGDAKNRHRTSFGTYFKRAETPLLARIEDRLARLTDWPVDRAEGLQILRYRTGQEYRAHHDWFEDKPQFAKLMERGGQRLATTILYLSSPAEGGDTYFPKAGVQYKPTRGGAVFFHNVDAFGREDELSLHGGRAVVSGVKIIATYWQRAAEVG